MLRLGRSEIYEGAAETGIIGGTLAGPSRDLARIPPAVAEYL
jgi:hypothetical protein